MVDPKGSKGGSKMAAKTFLKSALTIFAISILLAHLTFAAPPRYEIIDLGTLGGGDSGANAINEGGQVVGWSKGGDYSESHAFFWDPTNGMVDLGVLPDTECSYASALNDFGVIVGSSGHCDDDNAFIWDSINGLRYLEEGLSSDNVAEGINNAGQVIGWVWQAAGSFLWDSDNGVIYLGTLGGYSSSALAINNNGEVVGGSVTSAGEHHAFIWDSINGMRDLGTLGGTDNCWASDISDNGHVVGCSERRSDDAHAFIWDSGTGMIDLGPGYACAINNSGQIVGYGSRSAPVFYGPAFYWDNNIGMIKLCDLLPPSCGWTELRFALDINSRGQIVGQGITDAGKYHAFLMTPVLPTIEVPMKFTPKRLNCHSQGNYVKANLVLPVEFTVEDVDSNSLTTVHPLGVEPSYTNISVNGNGSVEIAAVFDRACFCSILRNSWFSEETITIRGSFISGQYFYGMDTTKVVDKAEKN
jgi:probable HAF family extracellular repeat protein